MKVAIIGAGLAGLSCGHVLKQFVSDVNVYDVESDIHKGASGNPVGLVNPRISAFRTPESDYYTSAFAGAVRTFDTIVDETDWHKCGALHLVTDEKKEKRFSQTLKNWGWNDERMRRVDAREASQIAGIELSHDALYLPDSGYLDPRKLCQYYAQSLDVRLSSKIETLNDIDADIIVLACGNVIQGFEETKWIPTQNVRGQITQVSKTDASSRLRCNLNYGGYCAPAIEDVHTLGATFQRWLNHTDLLDEDDADNINKLSSVAPSLTAGMSIQGRRASMRCASKDHFPIVGRLDDASNIYLSAAHGSHGIISSLAAARLLGDMILDRPFSQSKFTVNALSPQRFRDVG